MLNLYLLNERNRYQSLLLKLKETERKCERLEEEKNILINMVQEEKHYVLFVKEELKRSLNVVENENDSSRIRTELEARFISRLVIEDESNDDALTEEIDEEEHRDMNRLIENDDEEPVNIEDTLDLDQHIVDESIHLPKNNSSVDQCNMCNMEYGNAKQLNNHIKNYHNEDFGNNEQKTSGSHDVADDITVTKYINIHDITKKDKLNENDNAEELCYKKETEEHDQIHHSGKQNKEAIHPILLQLLKINREQPNATHNSILSFDVPKVTNRKRKLEGLKITISKEVHLIHDLKSLSASKKKCNKVLKKNKKQKNKRTNKSVVQTLALKIKRKCKLGPGCLGCLTPECAVCRFCLDRPSRGGSFTLRQKCVQRTCKTDGA